MGVNTNLYHRDLSSDAQLDKQADKLREINTNSESRFKKASKHPTEFFLLLLGSSTSLEWSSSGSSSKSLSFEIFRWGGNIPGVGRTSSPFFLLSFFSPGPGGDGFFSFRLRMIDFFLLFFDFTVFWTSTKPEGSPGDWGFLPRESVAFAVSLAGFLAFFFVALGFEVDGESSGPSEALSWIFKTIKECNRFCCLRYEPFFPARFLFLSSFLQTIWLKYVTFLSNYPKGRTCARFFLRVIFRSQSMMNCFLSCKVYIGCCGWNFSLVFSCSLFRVFSL